MSAVRYAASVVRTVINGLSSVNFNYQIPESQVERPEGFQGNSKDTFVRDDSRELENEKTFKQMGELFLSKKHKHKHKDTKAPGENSGGKQADDVGGPERGGRVKDDPVSMFPGREGYKSDFLGIDYPMPTLDGSIKDQAAHLLNHPDEIELKYNHFSVVQNAERRQCFFTACNIDGNQSQNIKRSGEWVLDGRIARSAQLGNEAYADNNIDKGHMVRRLDPAWGSSASLASTDTFVYTNSAMQHADCNQKEWLNLENHVLKSAQGQKMTVLTGPVFSDDDRVFDNHGRIDPPTKIPEKFWKVVVWKDGKTNQLKTCAFVMSQSDILDQDGDLFKGGFKPGYFSIYQVPMTKLEDMTKLHFSGAAQDITSSGGCRLDESNGFKPQGL